MTPPSNPAHLPGGRGLPMPTTEAAPETILPESPLERAKRLSRPLISVDELVGITQRIAS